MRPIPEPNTNTALLLSWLYQGEALVENYPPKCEPNPNPNPQSQSPILISNPIQSGFFLMSLSLNKFLINLTTFPPMTKYSFFNQSSCKLLFNMTKIGSDRSNYTDKNFQLVKVFLNAWQRSPFLFCYYRDIDLFEATIHVKVLEICL